jgi:hypothetical protein
MEAEMKNWQEFPLEDLPLDLSLKIPKNCLYPPLAPVFPGIRAVFGPASKAGGDSMFPSKIAGIFPIYNPEIKLVLI